jgi:hypothetical protein
MSDWVLVAALVGFAVVVTSFLWIGYGAQRFWDLKRRHAREVEEIHKSYTMQVRTYGSVPVEKLIGREDSATSSGP